MLWRVEIFFFLSLFPPSSAFLLGFVVRIWVVGWLALILCLPC